jgi:hypothetical protein
VALLNLQELDSQGKSIRGMAVNIQEIYDAIYGKEVVKEVQCGPRSCPPKDTVPRKGKPAPSQGTGNLRPEVPFVLPVLPEIVVIPELPELPGVPIMSDDARAARQAVIDRNQQEPELDYVPLLWPAAILVAVIILVLLIRRAERRKRK